MLLFNETNRSVHVYSASIIIIIDYFVIYLPSCSSDSPLELHIHKIYNSNPGINGTLYIAGVVFLFYLFIYLFLRGSTQTASCGCR